jgi:DNA-binding NarL/FixJ family response regulator
LLIVDDEPDMLQILRQFAAAAVPGVEVLTASSGPSALALMRQRTPHAILSDYRMPAMDGSEFLHRSVELAPAARRMLMTAYADSSLAERTSRKVPLDGYFEKSRGAAELARLLQSVCLA